MPNGHRVETNCVRCMRPTLSTQWELHHSRPTGPSHTWAAGTPAPTDDGLQAPVMSMAAEQKVRMQSHTAEDWNPPLHSTTPWLCLQLCEGWQKTSTSAPKQSPAWAQHVLPTHCAHSSGVGQPPMGAAPEAPRSLGFQMSAVPKELPQSLTGTLLIRLTLHNQQPGWDRTSHCLLTGTLKEEKTF